MSRGRDVTSMKRTYRTVTERDFSNRFQINLVKEIELRYGENPNQGAAIFNGDELIDSINMKLVKSGKGGLSATNYMDAMRAFNILKYFDNPSVAVMKHLVPCGFATQYKGNSINKLYELARDTDARSAFGSVVVLNTPLDKPTAESIMSTYVEVVAAIDFEEGVMDILNRKKDIRGVIYFGLENLPKVVEDNKKDEWINYMDLKFLPPNKILVQDAYLTSIKSSEDLVTDAFVMHKDEKYLVERDPTENEINDLMTAWYINFGVRSNGIVFVKDGVTLAVGTGEQERVGAVEQAITKTFQKALDRKYLDRINDNNDPKKWTPGGMSWVEMLNELGYNPLEGSVISSDAFFPFRDSIDILGEKGVTAIIQPGGSVRDYEVIQAVNEYGMAMALTLERCFSHH